MISFIVNDLYLGITRGFVSGLTGFYAPIIASSLYYENKTERFWSEVGSFSRACGYFGFIGASMIKSKIFATTYLLQEH